MIQIEPQAQASVERSKNPHSKAEAPLVADDTRDVTLSHADAVAGCPPDLAVAGEEDAGIGIECLVQECDVGEE